MKKLIYSLFFFLFVGQMTSAQNLNYWVSSLALIDNVEYQQIDRRMLDLLSLQSELESDSVKKKQYLAYYEKLDAIDFINLTSCSSEVKVLFLKDLDNLEDNNGYETLFNERPDGYGGRVVVKREDELIVQVFTFLVNEKSGEIVVIRMNGKLDDDDIAQIFRQPPR